MVVVEVERKRTANTPVSAQGTQSEDESLSHLWVGVGVNTKVECPVWVAVFCGHTAVRAMALTNDYIM